MRGEVPVERRNRGVQVTHQVVVAAELGVVRVEAAKGDVEQLHAGASDDELGGELEGRRELVLG